MRKPVYLYEKMELAAKLRNDELEKEKMHKFHQKLKDHKPFDHNEMRRHQERVDR